MLINIGGGGIIVKPNNPLFDLLLKLGDFDDENFQKLIRSVPFSDNIDDYNNYFDENIHEIAVNVSRIIYANYYSAYYNDYMFDSYEKHNLLEYYISLWLCGWDVRNNPSTSIIYLTTPNTLYLSNDVYNKLINLDYNYYNDIVSRIYTTNYFDADVCLAGTNNFLLYDCYTYETNSRGLNIRKYIIDSLFKMVEKLGTNPKIVRETIKSVIYIHTILWSLQNRLLSKTTFIEKVNAELYTFNPNNPERILNIVFYNNTNDSGHNGNLTGNKNDFCSFALTVNRGAPFLEKY